jgi:tetratricopeptide (TPR) repeat protein
MVKAKTAALEAVVLDDNLAEAHCALAIIRGLFDHDWVAAKRGYETAIKLKPGYVWARWTYGGALASMGQIEAGIAQLKRARELDPLAMSPTKWDLGWLYALNGEDDKALAQWAQVIELAPNYHATYQHLGNFHCLRGTVDEGIAALERARMLSPADPHIVADLAYCHARGGQRAEAEELLAELEERSSQRYVSPMTLALTNVGLGQHDEALQWLERAYEVRANMLTTLGMDPRYDPLRSDPRFQDLMGRLGFSEWRLTL